MNNSYNPYDILKRDDVKKCLEDVIDRIKLQKTPLTDQIAKGAFGYATKIKTIVGTGLAKIVEIGRNYDLQQLQREQIAHLKDHPEDLGRELRFLLVLSVLLLENTFELKEKANFFGPAITLLRNWIRTGSFQEGMVDTIMESSDRHTCEMWIVLKAPLSLLMNSYYLNENVSSTVFDSYLSDLVSSGKKSGTIKSLCLYNFQSDFLNGSVKSYLENRFDEVLEHKDVIPHLERIKDISLNLRDSLIEELNEYEKETDEFYRGEIEQWAKDYPANESGENYNMVVNALTTCCIDNPKITLGNLLIDDLGINQQQRQQLSEEFNKTKGFVIDPIYMDRFKTVGEIVSFWDAYDHLTPLDMTP